MAAIISAAPAGRRVRRRTAAPLLPHLLLLGGGFLWMYPFLWALGSSLKSTDGFFNEGLNFIPQEVEWSNFVNAWNEASFGRYFVNTVFTAALTVLFTLLFTGMAGYVLARTRFPGKTL